jgi:Alpha/beta hydrolase
VPAPAGAPPTRLAVSADYPAGYAATARAMSAAGYGDMAAGRHFLAFDPAGDGRAVEVIGDLSTARRIVILVPGNDTTLRDFDRGLGGVARRAPATQARTVFDAVNGAVNKPDVAVVAWLGYDSPEGMGMATVREERARAGAVELQRFIAVLPARATVVVVGHSYGSAVVGLAAPGFGPAVTDLVALASPGMGVCDVAELRTGARIWAGTADRDWIRRVPHLKIAGFGHGADPTAPGFGARILPTGNVSNHDSYLVPGSATLAALVSIVLYG